MFCQYIREDEWGGGGGRNLDNHKTRTGGVGTGKVNILLVVRDVEALDGGCVRARVEDRVSRGQAKGQEDGGFGFHGEYLLQNEYTR